ncbi:MAG: toxin-antitoxin system HicB family antitoxin, partial [Mesorhizobium sp.]
GKLVLRMPKSLHQRTALYAERDGVSLNQFIVTCLAEQVGLRARPVVLSAHSMQTALAPLFLMQISQIVAPSLAPQQDYLSQRVASGSDVLRTHINKRAMSHA